MAIGYPLNNFASFSQVLRQPLRVYEFVRIDEEKHYDSSSIHTSTEANAQNRN